MKTMTCWTTTVVLASLMACSASSNTPPMNNADAGNMPDVVTGGSDSGTPTTDRGTTPTDRGTTPTTDRGGGENFGTCGMTTVQALCMCGMDAMCQARAQAANPSCAMCISQAAFGCCPTQGMAVSTCAMDNMCMDQSCLQANCATQLNALQSCFNMAQQSSTSCQNMLAGCFGSFPPACM